MKLKTHVVSKAYEILSYVSSFSENDFEVEMNYTPDSDRVGLEGQYILHFNGDLLQLVDPDEQTVMAHWHFRHLRRIGYNQSQNKFLIDAGRRCGEYKGVFDFCVNDDPRDIIEAMKGKPGCDLKLSEKANRISTLIYWILLQQQLIFIDWWKRNGCFSFLVIIHTSWL